MGIPPDSQELGDALALGKRLTLHLRAFAAQLDFGDLDLPEAIGSAEDKARVRSAATLYFASELESARLLPALDVFTGLWASGALPVDLGQVGERVIAYHRARHKRLTRDERAAIFGRLFGTTYGPDFADGVGRNVGFESAMIAFAAALSDLETNSYGRGPRPGDVARLRVAASQLAGGLAQRALGISAFAGEELLGNIRIALEVFKQRAVQGALGAFTLWDAVRRIAERYLQESIEVQPHLTRARSGLVLLAWLADQLASLTGDAALFDPPADDIVMHAVRWMQATLELHESGALANRSPAGG
ncbi:MAG: hypothetical protein ACT4R6_08370 [Gemmatimonadaceae bacterium]